MSDKEGYHYDGHGRRIMSWRPDGGLDFSFYGNSGQLWYHEYDAKSLGVENVYLAGSLIASREFDWNAGTFTTKYHHTDALGSPVAVTNSAGQVTERTDWEPYGAAIGKPNYEGIGFTGHVQDAATGLTYMQERYYDSQVGLFLSVDPVTADSKNGALFNRYMYAANNPYRFFDPDGRCTGSRIENADGTCKGTGGFTTQSMGSTSTVPAAPRSSYSGSAPAPSQASERTWFDRNIGERNWFTGTGSLTDFDALAHDVGIPLLSSPQGGTLAAGFKVLAVPVGAAFNWARAGHIFRAAAGHVNPATAASQARFAQLFRAVSSNPSYLRADAVQAGIITQQAANAGVSAYTYTTRGGQQIWVTVRNGEIMNAGVNAAGVAR